MLIVGPEIEGEEDVNGRIRAGQRSVACARQAGVLAGSRTGLAGDVAGVTPNSAISVEAFCFVIGSSGPAVRKHESKSGQPCCSLASVPPGALSVASAAMSFAAVTLFIRATTPIKTPTESTARVAMSGLDMGLRTLSADLVAITRAIPAAGERGDGQEPMCPALSAHPPIPDRLVRKAQRTSSKNPTRVSKIDHSSTLVIGSQRARNGRLFVKAGAREFGFARCIRGDVVCPSGDGGRVNDVDGD